MRNFTLLSTDISLWEVSTRAKCGLLDFCPAEMHFQVQVIMLAQLNTLSQVGTWGDMEKPQWDMAFMLVAPSINAGCERVFGITTMWAHPHQAHYPTLEGAAQKLLLWADDGPDWLYTFSELNDTVSQLPLSSEGHISAITDGMPSMNACGQLHQLQVQKLLQHRGWVVCPEGLNREFKALQFTFQELLL